MPDRISALLAGEDDSNCLRDIIPVLATLLRDDKGVRVAHLCRARTPQIWKLPGEGPHFCGYRNLQMLWMSIPDSLNKAARGVQGARPTVLELQAVIEQAWDRGINPHARMQTGGVTGTRKWIGSSEVEAVLLSLGVACTGYRFSAWSEVLDFSEAYFSAAAAETADGPAAGAPPIFLQRPGHSLTIVGFERRRDGGRGVLVFDPAWRAPEALRERRDLESMDGWKRWWVSRGYRKGEQWGRKWRCFEVVAIDRKQVG